MSDRHPYYAAIESALKAAPGDQTAIALTHGRIFADQLPNDPKLPAVRYALIADTPEHRFASGDNTTAIVQVDVYAERSDQRHAWDVDRAMRTALDRVNMAAEGFVNVHCMCVERGHPFAESGYYRVKSSYRMFGSAA